MRDCSRKTFCVISNWDWLIFVTRDPFKNLCKTVSTVGYLILDYIFASHSNSRLPPYLKLRFVRKKIFLNKFLKESMRDRLTQIFKINTDIFPLKLCIAANNIKHQKKKKKSFIIVSSLALKAEKPVYKQL